MKVFTLALCFLLFSQTFIFSNNNDIQTPKSFIHQCFNGEPPKSKNIWIKKEIKKNIEHILKHSFSRLRIRYWKKDNLSVWVLDEIGKEAAITFGVSVKNNSIHEAKVLVYRESRGYEITRKSFQEQFHGATLNKQLKLNKNIDGISGATLSVRAMSKTARIALYLNTLVQ